MKIFITGGLGFIGRHLSGFFLSQGHRVTAVGTRPSQHLITHDHFRYISADTTRKGTWQDALQDTDAVINLAGKSIFKRWTQSYKQLIYESRILTTRNLVEALPANKGITLCSASGIGFYGNRGNDTLPEDETSGSDFLAGVSRDWEAEAFRAREKGVRVATARFGIVLGQNGGAMEKMVPALRLFVGGPMGDGSQWFPWIHLEDLLWAMKFVVEHEKIDGPVNFCAPQAVRNRDFAKIMGRVLRRPAFMPAPGFMIRLILGEFGTSLLFSQRAVPDKLISYGFRFKYPEVEAAIRQIVEK
ncbi:MAG: TIGR01777 family oxidoreductase [Pseudomonadota bacterium]|uniref:TIGR01777 family protein n=1 Tax=Candidatus Desulfatibia profunda TaxID=2841695 RepID=A0A8J6NR61_9BACT|nr:TIGR01777 family protein [Candidatus Desulfatibia profunda]MBL7181034.1 TIGR01777 family protein [Desulfobacterales bacterium]